MSFYVRPSFIEDYRGAMLRLAQMTLEERRAAARKWQTYWRKLERRERRRRFWAAIRRWATGR